MEQKDITTTTSQWRSNRVNVSTTTRVQHGHAIPLCPSSNHLMCHIATSNIPPHPGPPLRVGRYSRRKRKVSPPCAPTRLRQVEYLGVDEGESGMAGGAAATFISQRMEQHRLVCFLSLVLGWCNHRNLSLLSIPHG